MNERILDIITSPADLKVLDEAQLKILAREIRDELIATTSRTGGHLAPSLGATDLIIAIHRALDCPRDRILFDVGHQAYAHKLISGRLSDFSTLRTYGGLSGFPKRNESVYDAHDAGHASDSLSTALGLAIARDLRGGDETILTLIGDASISGGMAFEALNQIGQLQTKMTIVLNDNEMSISRNVGALSLYLAQIRLDKRYVSARDKVEGKLDSTGSFGRFLVRAGEAAKGSFKQLVVPGMYFEEMGLKYVGPIDGHDILAVQAAVERSKGFDGPVFIHAVTRKGAGYAPAEAHPDTFHGVGPFDPETGVVHASKDSAPSYTRVFSDELIAQAEENEDIVAITAAMSQGTGLDRFAVRFPNRFFDAGIAEEHAVTMASGLAIGGKIPVVAIYSTFLQRAFDQMIINVALQEQHVVFCLDRAGLVGEDGPTHHGAFDLTYLRLIPGMSILAPSNEAELKDALHTAIRMSSPVAIRYPRGAGEDVVIPEVRTSWEPGRSVRRRECSVFGSPKTPDVEILAVGRMVNVSLKAADLLEAVGISVAVTDMRWVKPIDESAIAAATAARLIVTAEEGTMIGGFGSAVLETLAAHDLTTHVGMIALPDCFIEQGATSILLSDVGLSPEGVRDRILSELGIFSESTPSDSCVDEWGTENSVSSIGAQSCLISSDPTVSEVEKLES